MLPTLSVTQFQPGTIAALPLAYEIYVSKLALVHLWSHILGLLLKLVFEYPSNSYLAQ